MSISSAIGSLGFKPGVCTSTTRPAAPYEGQLIFETDTDSVAFWDGSYWRYIEARKNLLYNGAMQVAQRGVGPVTGLTSSDYRTADRWLENIVTQGTWTNSVESDAPTGSGFRQSLKMLCTTIDASPSGSDVVSVDQRLEGQDLQAIRKGTSSAQQLTISFWVKSNVTGTYIAFLYDNDNARSVSKSYTISSSGTWEFKTLTFPADTTGAFDNDNNLSLIVRFFLGAGPNWSSGTLQTTWGTDTAGNRAVGQVNVAATANNYWQVTGVQLNVGAVAAPFEFKSYQQDLRECQRYYYRMVSNALYARFGLTDCSAVNGGNSVNLHPVQMRTNPSSIDQTGTASNYAISEAGTIRACTQVPTINTQSNQNVLVLELTTASVLTVGRVGQFISNNTSTAYIGVSAEL